MHSRHSSIQAGSACAGPLWLLRPCCRASKCAHGTGKGYGVEVLATTTGLCLLRHPYSTQPAFPGWVPWCAPVMWHACRRQLAMHTGRNTPVVCRRRRLASPDSFLCREGHGSRWGVHPKSFCQSCFFVDRWARPLMMPSLAPCCSSCVSQRGGSIGGCWLLWFEGTVCAAVVCCTLPQAPSSRWLALRPACCHGVVLHVSGVFAFSGRVVAYKTSVPDNTDCHQAGGTARLSASAM